MILIKLKQSVRIETENSAFINHGMSIEKRWLTPTDFGSSLLFEIIISIHSSLLTGVISLFASSTFKKTWKRTLLLLFFF